MAKPNYQFKKRQKELARKKKKEEKRLRKLKSREGEADETEKDPLSRSDDVQENQSADTGCQDAQ